MKKFISLLLFVLMFIGVSPAYAEELITVSITSVEEGGTYQLGSPIPLMIETNVHDIDIKHINFYANGIKLSGAAPNASNKLFWMPETTGDYALTAMVTTTADGEITTQRAVNVQVVSSNEEDSAMPVATPEIADGKENVSNELLRYTIRFNKEMDISTLKKANVTVEGSKYGIVTIRSVIASPDAMVLTFSDQTFAYDETYTVTLDSLITDVSGTSIGEDVSWTFKTVNAGIKADMIASVVYPEEDATISASDIILTTRVIFPHDIKKVTFQSYPGDTVIGEAEQGIDGEYFYVPNNMTIGEQSVVAVISYGNNQTLTTDAVSFNVTKDLSYDITGLYDGEKVMLNLDDEIVTSKPIGISVTEGVQKVTYLIDGVVKATVTDAPFTWNLPIDVSGSHRVSAQVSDVYNTIHLTNPVTYQGVLMEKILIAGDNFENGTVGQNVPTGGANDLFPYQRKVNNEPYGSMTYAQNPTDATDTVASVTAGTGNGDTAFGLLPKIPESKLMLVEYDTYLTNPGQAFLRLDPNGAYQGSGGMGAATIYHLYLTIDQQNFKSGKNWNKVSLLFDFGNGTCVVTVNGKTYNTLALDKERYGKATYASLMFMGTGASFMLDDLSVYALSEKKGVNALALSTEFSETVNGWTGDFLLANYADKVKEATVFYAVYDDDDRMIKAELCDVVNVPAGAVIEKSYEIPKTHGDVTAKTVRAFVWESVNGAINGKVSNLIR